MAIQVILFHRLTQISFLQGCKLMNSCFTLCIHSVISARGSMCKYAQPYHCFVFRLISQRHRLPHSGKFLVA